MTERKAPPAALAGEHDEWHKVLEEARVCARSWEPGVRILGNVRAGDLAAAITTLQARVEDAAAREAALVEALGNMLEIASRNEQGQVIEDARAVYAAAIQGGDNA